MTGAGLRVAVRDVKKKLGDVFAHVVEVLEGRLEVGAALELKVDHANRAAIRANHSATHLLHEALRIVLGDHVAQKGSLVAPERLRFDFAHPKPVSAEELARVEDIANAIVLQNDPVTTRLMGLEEARESGARALFGEKYGDEVRVVSMGDDRRRQRPAPLFRGTCAAAPMSRAPATSASSPSSARAPWLRGCAGSRRRRATSRAGGSIRRRAGSPTSRNGCAARRPRRASGSTRWWRSAGGSNANSPRPSASWRWAAASRAATACARSRASSFTAAPSKGST